MDGHSDTKSSRRLGGLGLMPFPFTANYQWGDGKGIAQRHFATAKREHEDLCDIARVLNNLKIVAVAETSAPSLERTGSSWTIKIPCKLGKAEKGFTLDGHVLTLQQVSICVANQTKTMLILGSEPY